MRFLFVALLLATEVAFANSYSIEVIPLPTPESVAAFTNGLPASTGERESLKKEDIIKFLKDGVYVRRLPSKDDHLLLAQRMKPADGLFTDTQGKFYWWTLISPNLLWLRTNYNGSAVIELKKN